MRKHLLFLIDLNNLCLRNPEVDICLILFCSEARKFIYRVRFMYGL